MKRLISLLNILLVLGLLLAGCATRTPTETATEEPMEEPTEEPTEAPVTATPTPEPPTPTVAALEISTVLADPNSYEGRTIQIRGTFVQPGAGIPIEVEDPGVAMLVEDYDLYLQNMPLPPGTSIIVVGQVYRDDLKRLYDEQGFDWPPDDQDPLEEAEIVLEGELVPADEASDEIFQREGFDPKPWPDSRSVNSGGLPIPDEWMFRTAKTIKVTRAALAILGKAPSPPLPIAGAGGPQHTLPAHSYAIIISGGVNANSNKPRYLNDVVFAWKVFRELGMANADIEVLYASGAAVNVGGVNIVDGASNLGNVSARFTAVANKVKNAGSGHVYIVTTNHGGGYHRARGKLPVAFPKLAPQVMPLWTRFDGAAGDPTKDERLEFEEPVDTVDYNRNGAMMDRFGVDELLYLWGNNAAAHMHDDEFVTEVKKLRDEGATIHIVMEQCFGGGFKRDLLRLSNALWTMFGSEFASATSEEKVSYAGAVGRTNYDEYLYFFLSALRGANAFGVAVNADTDNDKTVSWREAHEYADSRDQRKVWASARDRGDDPQYWTLEFAGIVGPSGPVRLAAIEALDDYTVRITLNRPDAALLEKLSHPAFSIMSPKAVMSYGADIYRYPVGTGPYRFVEWVPDQTITLDRFDGYRGDVTSIRTLVYQVIEYPEARLAALLAGDADGADIAADDISTAEDYGMQVLYRPPTNVAYLGINRDHEPFGDERVRQAIALAIDKEELLTSAYPRTAQIATQFVPPGAFGHTDDLEDWPYDPETAKALLAEAGYQDGFETELLVMPVSRAYCPYPEAVGGIIQSNLANVGIHAEIVTYDWDTYVDAVHNGDVDLFLLGWVGDPPEATEFLDRLFGADAPGYFGQPFPRLQELLAGGATTWWYAREIYDEANSLIHDLVPAVPLAHNASAVAYRNTVSNVAADYNGMESYAPTQVSDSDTLIFARAGDSLGLDPIDEWDSESHRVTHQILEPLVAFEPGTTRITPALAEDWHVSPDLTEWTFHLRRGATFHDGTDFDAGAVVFNFERWWDKENPYHDGRTGYFGYFNWFFGGFKGE